MNSNPNRKYQRRFLRLTAVAAGLAVWLLSPAALPQSQDDLTMDVYKEETCACCVGWIDHMKQHGYHSSIFHPADLNRVKLEFGLQPQFHSCHTAVTASGYIFEGHIPEKYIAMFLENPPADALGLAVPGMPIGGPGMEIGNQFTPYRILLIRKDGSAEVFAEVNSKADQ